MDELKRVCKNCNDFDSKNNSCTIRYTRILGKGRVPMKRNDNSKACAVFMLKVS